MNKKKIFVFWLLVIVLLAGVAFSIFSIIKWRQFWPLIGTVIFTLLLDILCSWRIVSSNRTYLAKSCWLTVIICLPLIGLLTFLIFGINPLRYRKRYKYFKDHKELIAKEDFSFTKEVIFNSDFSRLFEYGYFNMSKPVYKDNHFEVIEDNTLLFEKSIELIRSAKESINVQSFIFNFQGFWTKILFAELIKKANSGVKVRLLYDWLGSWHRIDFKIYDELAKHGVEVGCFNPKGVSAFKGATNYRLHSKFIIVDNRIALYGGSNFSDEYLSMRKIRENWKDLNFIIEGPIVNSMNTTFVNYWLRFSDKSSSFASTQNLRNDIDIIFKKQEFEPSNEITQMLVFEPDFNAFAMENALLYAIYNAKTSIKMMTPYFCPPDKIIEALIKKHKEGVDIEIIVHNKNQKYIQMLNVENLSKLVDEGIKIHQFDGYLHSKLYIFDDRYVLTGSCNIDYRSIYLDFESWLIVYNKQFTSKMVDYFNNTKPNTSILDKKAVSQYLTKWNRFLCKLMNLAKSVF